MEVQKNKIKSIKKVGVSKVRNLTVHTNHTFITKNGIITHNCDYLSANAFAALRGTLEDERFKNNVRYILTCNYINKIPEPIQSRFSCINVEPIDSTENNWLESELKKRTLALLNALKIQVDDSALDEFIAKNSPDMRKIYNKIQDLQIRGVKHLTSDIVKQNSYSYLELWNNMVSKMSTETNYQYIVSNYSGQTEDVLNELGNEFIKWILDNKPNLIERIPAIIIMVADYQAKRLQVIDPVTNLLACIFSIQKILV